jgi:hypothetical protein
MLGLEVFILLIFGVAIGAYTSGSIGALVGEKSPSQLTITAQKNKVETNGDPVPLVFTGSNGNPLILLSEYGSETPFSIVNPQLQEAWTKTTITLNHVVNPYQLVENDDHLFVIGYDNGTVVKIQKSDYDEVATYTFSDGTQNQINGVSLTWVGGLLAALFTVVDDPWAANPNYQSSQIVFLNPNSASPTIPVVPMPVSGYRQSPDSIAVGKNACSLVPIQDPDDGSWFLFSVSIGGKQKLNVGNGENSRIESINVVFDDDQPVEVTVKTNYYGNTSNNLDFRGLTFKADGSLAYILTGNVHSYNPDNYKVRMVWQVFQTTLADLKGETDTQFYDIAEGREESILHNAGPYTEGYLWDVAYDNTNDLLFMGHGDSINVYDPSDFTLPRDSFDQSQLNTDSNGNLNSLSLCAESALARRSVFLRGYQPHAVASKSMTWPEYVRSEIEKAK